LLSSVRIGEGSLTGAELARATERAQLVVLSCCDIGMNDSSGLGLSRLLNQVGVPAVVGSVSPVADAPSVRFMGEFHRLVASGTGPASALVAARCSIDGSSDWASSAGFVCFGDGFGPVVPSAPVLT